jgi:PPP family 3-phenylpropionic acid transporter
VTIEGRGNHTITLMGTPGRVIALYVLMYAAFGVSSPFMPAFLASRGLGPEQLGILFATGTAIRLVSGPLCGRLADLTQALRAVMVTCTVLASLVALALLPADGFWPLLGISLLQAAVLAPITTLADAIALGVAGPDGPDRRFEYGWARGAGSAAFIVGTLLSGQSVGRWGLPSILVAHAALLLGAAGAGTRVPETSRIERRTEEATHLPIGGVRELLSLRPFRILMAVSALVLGSHAMHDAFAVIRWSAAGITPAAASVLWSESVAAEVVVFFLIGPWLLGRLGPAGVLALAAGAGVVRWVVMALTAHVAVLALIQPLHGLTFAALHLACMRLIAAIVPRHLAATAQALYAFGAAATTALLTVASGWLYARLGAEAFLAMALLPAAALPFTWRLRGARSARHPQDSPPYSG